MVQFSQVGISVSQNDRVKLVDAKSEQKVVWGQNGLNRKNGSNCLLKIFKKSNCSDNVDLSFSNQEILLSIY